MKLEPGLLQEIPRRAAGPLKVEIHDSLLDSGALTNLPPFKLFPTKLHPGKLDNDHLLPRHRRGADHRGAGGVGGEQRDAGLRDQRERDLHLQTLRRGYTVEDPLVPAQVQGKTNLIKYKVNPI